MNKTFIVLQFHYNFCNCFYSSNSLIENNRRSKILKWSSMFHIFDILWLNILKDVPRSFFDILFFFHSYIYSFDKSRQNIFQHLAKDNKHQKSNKKNIIFHFAISKITRPYHFEVEESCIKIKNFHAWDSLAWRRVA